VHRSSRRTNRSNRRDSTSSENSTVGMFKPIKNPRPADMTLREWIDLAGACDGGRVFQCLDACDWDPVRVAKLLNEPLLFVGALCLMRGHKENLPDDVKNDITSAHQKRGEAMGIKVKDLRCRRETRRVSVSSVSSVNSTIATFKPIKNPRPADMTLREWIDLAGACDGGRVFQCLDACDWDPVRVAKLLNEPVLFVGALCLMRGHKENLPDHVKNDITSAHQKRGDAMGIKVKDFRG